MTLRRGVPTQMRSNEAEHRIHTASADSSNVIITNHAADRMRERDITTADLFRILRQGSVLADPALNERGNWQCKIVLRLRGHRDAGAVTVLIEDGTLIVRTVEWEDMR